jgi:hypothetical protein
MATLNDDQKLARLRALREDLQLFGKECLKVRQKDTTIVPFVLNDAQQEVHRRLEEQKEKLGFIRALVLKGRQQGISTYTAARYYHRSSMRRGVNVYILAHEQPASDNLFGIVDRYQRNSPIAPHVGISNTKELIFDKLDSSYSVATAGTKAGGRGKATSLFHGSEVAFWANAGDHFAASVQGVPLEPGTEVILESTSAGAGGEFYERWLDAEAGRGDYIAIFLPWWLSKEYARKPEDGFTLSTEPPEEAEMSEAEYASTFGLSDAQMCWRRSKIIELRSLELFKREYPATPREAWTSPPGHESFISGLAAFRARKRVQVGFGPLVLGVDPASNGGDRFAISARRGNTVVWTKYRNKINELEGAAWIRDLIDQLDPVRVNIDTGNIGSAIVTILKSWGPQYVKVVRGVNFGETSQAKLAKPKNAGPKNRRAEMWMRMGDWLKDPADPASIPDMDALETDLTAPRLKPQVNNDFLLESKVEMKARKVRSPDLADSIALTFAFNEFFDKYKPQDDVPAVFGSPTGLTEAPKPVTYAPPVFGVTGWMGALVWGILAANSLLPMLWRLAATAA